ncbi:MAG: hypothetical protein AAFQ19_07815 [Pseudomonadota bacterium]
MVICLQLNGVVHRPMVAEVGPRITEVAQGHVDEGALADWLRGRDG